MTVVSHTVVLERIEAGWYRQLGDDQTRRHHRLYIDALLYAEMGKPETVTVTIEPGDRLDLGGQWREGKTID